LDRSMSMPGPGHGFPNLPKSQSSDTYMPMPAGSSPTSMPHGPYSPQTPQAPYSPQHYNLPQGMYPLGAMNGNPALPPHVQGYNAGMAQSPLRQSFMGPNAKSKYEEEFATSDSDSGRDRRRRRSKSRNRYSTEPKKKSHNKSKAAGVLMGVGGLTALLDGLSGL
jgi:hypothetical protein